MGVVRGGPTAGRGWWRGRRKIRPESVASTRGPLGPGRISALRELLAKRGGVLRLGGEGLGVLGEGPRGVVPAEAEGRRETWVRAWPERGAECLASRGRLSVVLRRDNKEYNMRSKPF